MAGNAQFTDRGWVSTPTEAETSSVAQMLALRSAEQLAGHRKAWRAAVKAVAAGKPLTEKQLDQVAEASRALGLAPAVFDEHVRLYKQYAICDAALAGWPSQAEVDAMTDEADRRCAEIDLERERLQKERRKAYDAAYDVANGRRLAVDVLKVNLEALPAVLREDL